MNRVLALKLLPESAIAVLVGPSADERVVVEAVLTTPLPAGDDAAARGAALSAALHELKPNRAPTVLAIPRGELSVLNLDLPPAPIGDLPDLVHLQAQRDVALAEDGEGFDFLPLEGSEDHPYKVLGVGLLPGQWKAIRETCDAADLRVVRIVPEPFGWCELGRRAMAGEPDTAAVRVFASIIQRQAVVWASEADRLRLLRSVWLPEDENAAADAAALGGELRRTLLSLAQSDFEPRSATKCIYIGADADEIAGELGATLSKPVQAVPIDRLVEAAQFEQVAPLSETGPMAALAAAVMERQAAPIDLLHPRRRPAAPNRNRTYVLAGIAAAALVLLLVGNGYRRLRQPLEAAEIARAEQQALEPTLKALATDEVKARSVRQWLDGSVNLLTELDRLGLQLRPTPLGSA
ncbi:MAG: hypothetical protein IT424_00215, partial [Pirellulales bacterium]|nr:hypothetical protein [Pirellulales bacterium]